MKNTYWFQEVSLGDVNKVGGKNSSLGEMIQNMSNLGIKVPDGFAVSCHSYKTYLKFNNLENIIEKKLAEIDYNKEESIREKTHEIRYEIQQGEFPADLETEIIEKYRELSQKYDTSDVDVAVRSSATTEDLENASFAGQQDTYLNIKGEKDLLEHIKKCFASIFNERAVDYRHSLNFDNFDISLSVGVQKMVRSDLGSSGVSFSLDTESGNQNIVIINSSFGLGEMVVSGKVEPDEFIVFKDGIDKYENPIVDKKMGNKQEKMIYDYEHGTKIIPTDKKEFETFSLDNKSIIKLASWVKKLEKYYSELKGAYCPVDVEWGYDGELYILQARPETVVSNKNKNKHVEYKLNEIPDSYLLEGVAVGDKIGSGKTVIMRYLGEKEFNKGDVLVSYLTDPDWEPIMKKASAIVCEKGGRTCHAAIVARELGIPALVGVENCLQVLEDNKEVTVSCSQGSRGYIYEGEIPFHKIEEELDNINKPPVSIMLNVGNPEQAYKYSQVPNEGVSLAREEFILSSFIKIHPQALLKPELLPHEKRAQLEKMITGYGSGKDYFVEKLAFGIGRIASAFHPHPVILRTGDMKTNEYKLLFGGEYFEPDERNPMIGYRGCSRYYDEKYREAFGLECLAIKKVREEMGLKNLIVMLPFCRTVEECLKTQEVMKEYGLERGKDGFQLYLMAEIPSNFILADEFLEHCDGFSIGSNDITQLALGLDRDSELLQHIYDEENSAIKKLIKMAIKACKAKGKKIGICGQGPSDKPSFADFLVKEGIDSLGLIPESVFGFLRRY